MSDSAVFMRSLDEAYRVVSGLRERRYYSIFYSKVEPHPILILGYNPGGNPETWSESALASRSYYENSEHEYVDCHYPLATAMRSFLLSALNTTDPNRIRSIPKTNLIFRRSTNQGTLALSTSAGLREAKPFVETIVARCQPRLIICEGTTTLNAFEKGFCTSVSQHVDGHEITTPNGRHRAAIYRSDTAFVDCLGRRVVIIGIGHPSKYAGRAEWTTVVNRASSAMRGVLSAA